MQLKDFLATVCKINESHIVVNEDGEPTAAIVPYERYREMVDGVSRRSHAAPNGRRTVSIPTPDTSSTIHETNSELQGVNEPHFQFEPLPDDEGLT